MIIIIKMMIINLIIINIHIYAANFQNHRNDTSIHFKSQYLFIN